MTAPAEFDDAFVTVLDRFENRRRIEREQARFSGGAGEADLDARLLAVGPDTGRLINLIARAMPAPTILEVGTSYGYSGLWLADAARASGGRLITLEIDADKSAYAKAQLAEAGLAAYVDFRVGDAAVLIGQAQERFDFVLLDLWKDRYVSCLAAFLPKLNHGAIVVADNMVQPGGIDADRYRAAVNRVPSLRSVALPVGTGLEVSQFIAEAGS